MMNIYNMNWKAMSNTWKEKFKSLQAEKTKDERELIEMFIKSIDTYFFGDLEQYSYLDNVEYWKREREKWKKEVKDNENNSS